ncbi:hypothetical protein SASPL_143711 [Salvia splendens]|uniref:Enoyl reductase (ER) domain-containing protein n=1 Tax=Salvia splendens TaxID=180675 RepID=A0A8X8ZA02_SALSN|nr:hypothetical protein SASPL_143711 [Salvia splendens]
MAKTPETEHPVKAFGYAATDSSGSFSPFKFSRRATGERDVQLKVLYCGVCHSDLHMTRNEHEIVGVVTEVGSKVEKVKIGDKVGVGVLVGSCRQCEQCTNDLENYCPKQIQTYGFPYLDGTINRGGYSNNMVADEHFIIRWPDNFPLDAGAPLLCAGITTYSPLRYFGLDKPGLRIGVNGLGGLGHVAVKFAKAFGTKVTVISTSLSKKKEAIERLGVDEFLVSRDPEQMQAAVGTLDGIIDTVSASHPVVPLLSLLKPNGKLIIVGRKTVAGSGIGGMKETQEMIDFAAKNKIVADVEVIPIDYINTAMDRLLKSDVKYRFVIDVGNSLKPE